MSEEARTDPGESSKTKEQSSTNKQQEERHTVMWESDADRSFNGHGEEIFKRLVSDIVNIRKEGEARMAELRDEFGDDYPGEFQDFSDEEIDILRPGPL